MSARLDRLDERLRGWLCAPAGRGARAALALLTAVAFFLLLMTRTLVQLTDAPLLLRAAGVAVLTLPLAVMLLFGMGIARERAESAAGVLLTCALCALAMLARLSFVERSSGDYDIYLAAWLEKLAEGSFADGMKADIGEYNVLYQYILFLITRLPVPPLYAVKAVSFIGDAALAGAVAALAARDGRPGMAAFGAMLLLPTAVLNGGMFAQCDSLYAACALWGLALALRGRPVPSAVCFALSLAFKLQAVFLLPIVAVLWADRRLRVADAGVFLLTLAAVMLPAVLGGKSPARIIGIYMAQTGLYTGLNYGAANLFGLMPTQGLDVYAYGGFAMALALGACVLLVGAGMRRAGHMTGDDYVHLALLLVLLIVFLLPRMHERYFYLAGALSVALACRLPRMIPAAALIELASLSTYWALELPLAAASGMMLAAIVLVLASFAGWGRNLLSEGKA